MTQTIIFYSVSITLLIISWFKDRKKTKMALRKSYKALMNLLPALVPMILFVGILLTYLSPQLIGSILGTDSGIIGVFLALILGSVAFMPSFVAFNLGSNLIAGGAGYVQVAALIATLMAVGISTLTIEVKYFDKKITMYRNGLALIASILFTFLVWRFMI